MKIGRKKRGGWEVWFLTLLVGFTFALAIAIYAQRDRIAKEQMLTSELFALRGFVTSYTVEIKRHPITLVGPWIALYGLRDPMEGKPLHDPFGYPYRYNSGTGQVGSGTPGYGHW